MAYEIGDRVGDYQIVAVLGAGGMGKVYQVRNAISDRVEAMKVLLPNLESDPDLADRFMREIKVQASLDHSNIAGLHTALRVNNQLLMLIEFVEGRTIEAELRNGRIPVERAVDYIKQVLTALSYAHSRGVVHRDIKPANMMVTPEGVVKLMDFGIARATADRKLTRTGQAVGSLYYMSPEQIQGADVDARSDLYSVGVSLYEMCTNRRPFQGDSEYSIMAAHLNAMPVPPIEIDPSLPPALNEIILMSIAKDPARRFQTAAAFQGALNSLAAAPVPQPAAVKPPFAASPGGRRGLYMALGSVATVLVLVLAAYQGPKFFRASSAATPVPQRTVEAPPQPTPAEPAESPAASPVAEEKKRPTQNEPNSTGRAQYASKQPPAVDRPVQIAQNTAQTPQPAVSEPPPVPQQSQAATATPAAPTVDPKELDDLQERFMLLATRANSIRGSLTAMRKQMGSLNLNAEFTTREQRMEAYLDQAEAALKATDLGRGKKNLESAERVIEELEKRLGR
jgi:eukaryotic-like serine/threonine-protein kinase